MIGPRIIVPIVAVVVIVVAGLVLFKRYLKSIKPDPDSGIPSGSRLTAAALHRLPTPPWRVVYEVASDTLGGIDHVLIGPAGIFAITTSMAPMPTPSPQPPSAETVAKGAIARGDLDDLLRRCAMESTGHVAVYWGRSDDTDAVVVDIAHGSIAVSGHRIDDWFESLVTTGLSPLQADLAWQTVVTGIGRPDPLSLSPARLSRLTARRSAARLVAGSTGRSRARAHGLWPHVLRCPNYLNRSLDDSRMTGWIEARSSGSQRTPRMTATGTRVVLPFTSSAAPANSSATHSSWTLNS